MHGLSGHRRALQASVDSAAQQVDHEGKRTSAAAMRTSAVTHTR